MEAAIACPALTGVPPSGAVGAKGSGYIPIRWGKRLIPGSPKINY